MKKSLASCILTLCLIFITACGGTMSGNNPKQASGDQAKSTITSPPTAAKPEQKDKPLQKVTLRLNWLVSGEHAPFYVAKEKGYFAEQGLDVQILEGDGSATTVKLIGNKSFDIGYADSGTAAQALAKGLPVQVIASYVQNNPMAIIFKSEKGFKTPQDLIGKSVAVTQGDSLAQILPALLKLNKIEAGKVKIVSVGTPAAKETAMLTGTTDSFTAYYYDNTPKLEVQEKLNMSYIRYSEFGITILGSGLIVNKDIIKEKPDMLKAFVAAANKGWEFTRNSPEQAADILLKQSDKLNKDVVYKQTKLMIENLHTPKSKDKPTGWMADEDWKSSIDLLNEYADMKGSTNTKDYYTNDFIPSK